MTTMTQRIRPTTSAKKPPSQQMMIHPNALPPTHPRLNCEEVAALRIRGSTVEPYHVHWTPRCHELQAIPRRAAGLSLLSQK